MRRRWKRAPQTQQGSARVGIPGPGGRGYGSCCVPVMGLETVQAGTRDELAWKMLQDGLRIASAPEHFRDQDRREVVLDGHARDQRQFCALTCFLFAVGFLVLAWTHDREIGWTLDEVMALAGVASIGLLFGLGASGVLEPLVRLASSRRR